MPAAHLCHLQNGLRHLPWRYLRSVHSRHLLPWLWHSLTMQLHKFTTWIGTLQPANPTSVVGQASACQSERSSDSSSPGPRRGSGLFGVIVAFGSRIAGTSL